MTRTGKIARPPREIREQLNRRLQDGETGTRIVQWLNDLPESETPDADFDQPSPSGSVDDPCQPPAEGVDPTKSD